MRTSGRGSGLRILIAGSTTSTTSRARAADDAGRIATVTEPSLGPTTDPVPASIAVGVSISLNAHDPKALIRWMQDVLGFDLVALYEDLDDGHVRASRLELGNHAVHVSQRAPSDPGRRNVGMGVVAADEAAVDALYA